MAENSKAGERDATANKPGFQAFDPASIEPYIVKDPEALTVNMARTVEQLGKAASAWLAPRESGEKVDTAAEPMIDMVKTLSKVSEYWLADPRRTLEAQTMLLGSYFNIWSRTLNKLGGKDVAAAPDPHARDKRFSDEDWVKNPFFDFLRQAYFVTSDWADKLVSDAEGLDEHTRHKAGFYVKQIASAISPTNFITTNPQLYRETVASNGANLVRGMKMLAEDIAAGGGDLKLRQTDTSKFAIGENMALTPGKVLAQSDVCQVIQYDATTKEVLKRPLLICPPWINKFYIMDLQPANSLIRWLSAQGFTVFVCSWVNPDSDKAEFGFEEYLNKGVYRAVEKTLEQTGAAQLNAVGYCIGGTLLGAGLAHMAAKGDKRVNATTFFAAQHDFAEAGDLLLFTDEHWLAQVEEQMDAAGGVLPGAAMAETFNALRANDLIWSFFVSNYLMGKAPPAFDLLFWNADQTRMPKRLHLDYLRRMYGQNALAKGEFEIDGQRIDLSTVKTPLYFLSSREDHIAPMNSVYRSARLFGGPVTYTLAGSGHIAGVINPPAANKYQHWINPALPETLQEWQAGAEQHPGSWWTHWAAWLHPKSGEQIPGRDPKTGPLKPIEPAPGAYVKVKS